MGTTTQIDSEVTVALQGTLDTFALPDVLRLLAATRKSGRLRITGTRGTGSLWVDDGAVAAVDATHAPHATEAVDAMFELLRFEDGSFTFDADAPCESTAGRQDLEPLLAGAEALLEEWREIVKVVPSMDAWVTMRRTLPAAEVTIDQPRWTTLVAVGGGATVRRLAEDLCLPELPVSRAVRDLVETGLVEVEPTAPGSHAAPIVSDTQPSTHHDAVVDVAVEGAVGAETPPEAPSAAGGADEDAPLPTARPLRARRAKVANDEDAQTSTEPERFVPLELPGHMTSSHAGPAIDQPDGSEPGEDVDVADLAAAFPGLANRSAEPSAEDEELARQLATLSPRAASAVRAAAEATTIEARDAALDEVTGDDDEPINRGLLLKFLSSVKS